MEPNSPEFTGNSEDITLSLVADLVSTALVKLDEMSKQLDHADELRHETARQVSEIHAELEQARPMIEAWQHSKIRRLAQGQLPWQNGSLARVSAPASPATGTRCRTGPIPCPTATPSSGRTRRTGGRPRGTRQPCGPSPTGGTRNWGVDWMTCD